MNMTYKEGLLVYLRNLIILKSIDKYKNLLLHDAH